MDDTTKIAKVKILLNDNTIADDVVSSYLEDAKRSILDRLYPFDDSKTSMPTRYDGLQCRLASRYILRRGGEGEIAHNENGINRTYGSVNDEDLLCEVMQVISMR